MRLLAKLDDESRARTFCDYLLHKNIENKIALEADGTCELWIIWEDDMEQAEQYLSTFLNNPDDTEYRSASKAAEKIKKQKEREEKEQADFVDVRTTIFNRGSVRNGMLTLFLIIVSVAIGIFSKLGENYDFLGRFFITEVIREGAYIKYLRGLPEVMDGQVWRLVTPIFIHFGPLHLLFNMWWLKDLGSMIEDRKSSWFLAIFVVVIGAAGNLAQYIVSGPSFGGMSGVVYGLLGYIWMKGKYDPNSRLFLHKSTVTFMLIWFVLCFTGIMGPIANAAHTAGLVIGVIWGYMTSPHKNRYFRKD